MKQKGERWLVLSFPIRRASHPSLVTWRCSNYLTLLNLIDFTQTKMATLKSLETLALEFMPKEEMFKFLYLYFHAPIAKTYLPKFLEKCSIEELERMSRTIRWDHPLAREMDLAVHKRRLKGKTCFIFSPFSPPTKINQNFFICWQTNWKYSSNLNLNLLGTPMTFIPYEWCVSFVNTICFIHSNCLITKDVWGVNWRKPCLI